MIPYKLMFYCILLMFAGVSSVLPHWESVNSGVNTTLREVYFVDDLHGWAIGDNAVIIATTDGGETWTKQDLPISDFVNLYKIQFVNIQNGFITGSGTENTGDPDNPQVKEEVFLRTQKRRKYMGKEYCRC